ncbi:MAG: KR domain-containing protein, partial [Actinomycetes bacterium]
AGGYLITGSATEAGLLVAEELAASGARLVLVGPPDFPSPQTWSPALAGARQDHGDGADEPTQRMARLSHLLAHRPGQVTFMTADLSDAEQVRAVVDSATTRLGRLDGVFHLLDDRGSGMVAMKSREDLTATLDIRVRSTLLLDEALGGACGFLLIGSSTTGIVGGFGQLENCAVAAFLDSFAQSRSTPNRVVTTVDWGQWCWDDWFERQMADLPSVRADYEKLRRRYGIPVREGLDRTKAALGSGLATVVISTRDFRDVLVEQSTLTASRFTASLDRAGADATTGDWNPADIWPDDEVAQQVATVWHEMLGVRVSDPDTDFYTVGGNSLFAIQVVTRLRQVYGTFPMSAIFEAPTVSELAAA